jgi:NAD(P)-dependent dehydrogenase (short-subunit alcohol dehydrogenase family)
LPLRPIINLSPEELVGIFAVNVLAPLNLMAIARPHLHKTQRLVINISSDAAVAGYPNWGGYGASKAALDLITRTAASEWRDDGVSAYAVDPDGMLTDMHRAAIPEETDGLADPRVVARALLPLLGAAGTEGVPAADSGGSFASPPGRDTRSSSRAPVCACAPALGRM